MAFQNWATRVRICLLLCRNVSQRRGESRDNISSSYCKAERDCRHLNISPRRHSSYRKKTEQRRRLGVRRTLFRENNEAITALERKKESMHKQGLHCSPQIYLSHQRILCATSQWCVSECVLLFVQEQHRFWTSHFQC